MAVSTLPETISAETFLEKPERYHGRTVIAYCTVSYRSGLFLRDRLPPGWVAYNLRGGIPAWLHAGGVVQAKGRPVRRVHVYSRRWNYPPEGYEPVTFSVWERLFGPRDGRFIRSFDRVSSGGSDRYSGWIMIDVDLQKWLDRLSYQSMK